MKKGTEAWLTAGLIAFVTLVAYGVLIPRLGFYRDDWYLLWNAQAGGTDAIIALFQSDRPLIGYLYALDYAVLGDAPLGWHFSALIVRLAGNLAFFWLVRQLLGERKMETASLALLFAIYPGFVSQPNAGVYVNLLLANTAAVLSFALTSAAVGAARPGVRVAATCGAAFLALLYLGIFESMIGLEIARVALLWYLLWRLGHRERRSLIIRSGKWAVPYLLIAAGFAYWRLFVFESTRHATNLGFLVEGFSALPLRSIASILLETCKDAVETTFFAWVVPFYRFTATANYRDYAIAVLLGLVAAGSIAAYFRLLGGTAAQQTGESAPGNRQIALLGLFIVLVVLAPINAAGRDVLFEGQWDRYALPGAGGAVLAVSGLLFHFLQGRARQGALLAMVAMSVMVHYFSAAWYRDFWAATQNLWWQMSWRAPSLQRGTMLFVPLAEYAEGYEIYGPANMMYFPGEATLQVGAEVLNSETAAYLQAQKDLEHYDRSTLVPDNYDQALVAIFPTAGSCLHVLDGRLPELPGLIDGTLVSSVAANSRIGQILPREPSAQVPAFLGAEPAHDWCYYYQRIHLARQGQDWVEVARLMDEAQRKDLQPGDYSEWLPALEAYAALGRQSEARRAASILRISAPIRFYLCSQVRAGPVFAAPYDHALVQELVCGAAS